MDHIFTYRATTAFVFQKMDAIKRNAEEVKKVGIQMSGLITIMSVGGITQEKMKMLHDINEELVTKVNLIVDSSTKINSDLTEANRKVDSLRKDLASSKKRLFEATLERDEARKEYKKMKIDLDTSQESLTSLFDSLMDDDFQLTPSGKRSTSTPCKSSCDRSVATAVHVKDATGCSASTSATFKSNVSNKGGEEKQDDSKTEK